LVFALVLVAGGCGSPAPAPERPADRGDAEPPPATLEENEERIFDARITTAQETILLRDCRVLTPDASFLGSDAAGKHAKVFRVAIEERSFVDAIVLGARQALDDTVPGRVRPVLFSEIASIRIDPVRDYLLPVTITFRSRRLAGLVLTGSLPHALGLEGTFAPLGAPATVPLREVTEVVLTERPR
jgi:hypothetical protein